MANLTGPGIRPRRRLTARERHRWVGHRCRCRSRGERVAVGDHALVYPGLFCGGCEWCVSGETSACTTYGVIGEQCWGTHAEFVRVPARNLEPIPEGMTLDALACANGSWLTAWRALVTAAHCAPAKRSSLSAPPAVSAALRSASRRLAGARVLAVVGSAWKARHAEAAGADSVLLAGEATRRTDPRPHRRARRGRRARQRRRTAVAADHQCTGAVRTNGDLRRNGRGLTSNQHSRDLPAASAHHRRAARLAR